LGYIILNAIADLLAKSTMVHNGKEKERSGDGDKDELGAAESNWASGIARVTIDCKMIFSVDLLDRQGNHSLWMPHNLMACFR